jgi:hypothetical protein
VRWRFPDPTNAVEAQQRLLLQRAIDKWWAEFQRTTDRLDALFRGRERWDLPAWMHEHLNAIDPRLFWEFGPGLQGGHRLVITPEMKHALRPLVSEILHRAPRIPGWEFYAYRLPESLERTLATVKARGGGDVEGARFTATSGDGHLVHLTFHSAAFTGADEDRGPFFVAVETLLGEEILDKWIGGILVEPLDGGRGEPLDAMAERVHALIAERRAQLPERPCFEEAETARWTAFEVKPPERTDDYPEQSDLYVGTSMRKELWRTAHSWAAFASERFSRHGEVFGYLKLDGRDGLDEEHFRDKAEIEDALDAVLIPSRLGCTIGGGTGRWYSYIDLALTDVERGAAAVRQRLRAGNVPKRSWILFFDDEWKDEWIGIYDDTPPPPIETS